MISPTYIKSRSFCFIRQINLQESESTKVLQLVLKFGIGLVWLLGMLIKIKLKPIPYFM